MKRLSSVVLFGLVVTACDSGGGDQGPCGIDLVECAPAPGTDYPGAASCVDGSWVCPGDAGVADASGD